MHRNDFVRQLSSPGGDRRPSRVMHLDIPLLLLLLALCGIGLTVLFSASGESIGYVKRQATFMLVGLVSMIVVAQFTPRFWERWSIVIYAGGLLSLVAVLFFGVGAKGAQRWLDLGFFQLQPSEVMKVTVVLALARYFHGFDVDEAKITTLGQGQSYLKHIAGKKIKEAVDNGALDVSGDFSEDTSNNIYLDD